MKFNLSHGTTLSLRSRWFSRHNSWTAMVSLAEEDTHSATITLALPFLCAFVLQIACPWPVAGHEPTGERIDYGWTVGLEGGRLSWRYNLDNEELSQGWNAGFLWSDFRGRARAFLRGLTVTQLNGHVPIVGGWPDHLFLAKVTSKRIVTTYANPLCRPKTIWVHELAIDHPPSVPGKNGTYTGIDHFTVVADSPEEALAQYVVRVVDERRARRQQGVSLQGGLQAPRQATC